MTITQGWRKGQDRQITDSSQEHYLLARQDTGIAGDQMRFNHVYGYIRLLVYSVSGGY